MSTPEGMTDRDVQNVMLYGKCWSCGAIRSRGFKSEVDADGRKQVEVGLVCDCNRSEWPEVEA